MLESLLNDVLPYVLLLGVPILMTGMGLPVPEEVVVITAGVGSHNATFEPLPALLTCLVAAVMGDCFMYFIGYHFGHGLLREHPWFARLLNPRAERKMEHKIQRHGLKALFIARFLVGVRAPVYVAAGILRIPFRKFIICDVISATVVVSTFFGLSYLFAEQFNSVWQEIKKAEIALTLAIVSALAGVGIYFYIRHRRRVDRIRLRRLRRAQRKGNEKPPSAEAA